MTIASCAVRRSGSAALLAAVIALALLAAPSRAQEMHAKEPEAPPAAFPALDIGTMIVSQGGKPVRAEEFAIQRLSDTLMVRAASRPYTAPGRPDRPPDKTMVLVVSALDYEMGTYWSTLMAGADTLKRGIEVTPGDTLYTAWREFDGEGLGEAKVLPPGRLYILDPPLFTVFTLIGRSLQGKACDHRPIQVMVLGARDSIVAATVTETGNEAIRWGGRPVVARKLVVADERTTFTSWIAPDGRLLRLEQPQSGIVVEREAPPPAKRPPTRPR